jgi:aminotransferase
MKLKLVDSLNPSDLISRAARDIPPSGIREFFDIVYSTPDCISLGVGEPDFITPWRISDSGVYAIKDGCTHYTPNRGLPELRDVVAEYTEKKYKLSYDPDRELIITMGVSQGLDLALRSIVDPGDEVIIIEPCYVSYSANVTLLQGVPVTIPVTSDNGFALNIEDIKSRLTQKTKAIILNYPANPTGSTIDEATLKKIARLAIERNIIVISDELYSAILYDRDHFSIARCPGMKERTIYLNGFSKSHAMTGWRLGYVAGPEFLVNMMLKIHQYTALCAPSISQYAAVEALRRGEKDVLSMREEYRRRRNFIVNSFNDMGLKCPMPDGAFYVFPDISGSGMDSRTFALELLKKEKVAVVPGVVFGAPGENHIRCSYATSMENLKEAAARIARFIKGL